MDPGFEDIPLLRAIDPGFQVRRARLPGFVAPRIHRILTTPVGISTSQLAKESEETLWKAHHAAMGRIRDKRAPASPPGDGASLLDMKIELALRMLSSCRLCAHRCGVNRTNGEMGACRLGMEATVAEHFVHVAEESPINPSLVLNLAGCGLRCRFCQQSALLDPAGVRGERVEPALWKKFDSSKARSLSFIGGNPSESLYALLRFLADIPPNWPLPIVWNCHAYETVETVRLLEGIVDVYVPDFKYGNETCGRRLSGVPDYPATARSAIEDMLTQDAPACVIG